MSDNFHGKIKADSQSISISILLRKTSDNTEQTGIAHTSVTARYWRQGGSSTSITMASLSSVTDAHSAGGWIEVDAGNIPGIYRFDVPDAAFVTGADWVVVSIKVSGCYVFFEKFEIESGGVAEIYDEVTHASYGLDQLVRSATPANALAVSSSGRAEADLKLWLGTAPAVLTSQLVQAQANKLGATAKTEVNAEVDTALDESISELSVGAPAGTPSVRTGIMLMYMGLRNKLTNDGEWLTFYNDAGTAICKARVSETTGTFTRSEIEAV